MFIDQNDQNVDTIVIILTMYSPKNTNSWVFVLQPYMLRIF
jgi:hypothetical protein